MSIVKGPVWRVPSRSRRSRVRLVRRSTWRISSLLGTLVLHLYHRVGKGQSKAQPEKHAQSQGVSIKSTLAHAVGQAPGPTTRRSERRLLKLGEIELAGPCLQATTPVEAVAPAHLGGVDLDGTWGWVNPKGVVLHS